MIGLIMYQPVLGIKIVYCHSNSFFDASYSGSSKEGSC